MERDLDARQELGHAQERNMERGIRSTSRKKVRDAPGLHHRWAPCQLPSTSVRHKCSGMGEKVSMRIVRDRAVPPTGASMEDERTRPWCA